MKKILLLLGFCTLAVSAQTLDGRTECRYEVQTDKTASGTIRSHTRETCVEEPAVEIKQLKIGDVVRAGQLAQHPVIKQDFAYQNTRCRWFVESNSAQRDLVQYQGIACQVQPNVWRIVDKF